MIVQKGEPVLEAGYVKIPINMLNTDQQKILQGFLVDEHKNGVPILEEGFLDAVNGFKSGNIEKNTVVAVFKELSPKYIPPEDLEIIKASVLLKNNFDKGSKIAWTKRKIVMDYGERGRNICNLYSAGYFENLILPIYNELKDVSNGLARFSLLYQDIVEHYPFALFIHQWMGVEEVESQIKTKLEEMEKYGIAVLNIHGIGKGNKKTIRKAIVSISQDDKYSKLEFCTTELKEIIVVQISKE